MGILQTQGILGEGTVIGSQRQGRTYQKFKYASIKWLEKNKANKQKEEKTKHIAEFSTPGYRSALSSTVHFILARAWDTATGVREVNIK